MISVGRDEMEEALGPLAARHHFTPDYGHLTVFGTCDECAEGARHTGMTRHGTLLGWT